MRTLSARLRLAGQKAVDSLRGTTAKNLLSVFGLQVVGYVWPLAAIPFLTRVLGPAGWGRVAYAQAYALTIASIVDYSFSLSGTRSVARAKAEGQALGPVVTSIVAAKASVALAVAGGSFFAARLLPIFSTNYRLALMATAYGIVYGLNFDWYLQGSGRLRTYSILRAGSRASSLLLILLLVRSPTQAWLVLAIWGASATALLVVQVHVALQNVSFGLPRFGDVWGQIRLGFSMFLLSAAMNTYASANVVILGILAPPSITGFYSGAERIARASLRLMQPFNVVLLPKVTSELAHNRRAAERTMTLSLLASWAAATLLSLSLLLFAPFGVRVVLGPGFGPSIPVLRVLALLPIVTVPINVLGIQWMLPNGEERRLSAMTIVAGFVNAAVLVLLVHSWHQTAAAIALLAAELSLSCLIGFYVYRTENHTVLGIGSGR